MALEVLPGTFILNGLTCVSEWPHANRKHCGRLGKVTLGFRKIWKLEDDPFSHRNHHYLHLSINELKKAGHAYPDMYYYEHCVKTKAVYRISQMGIVEDLWQEEQQSLDGSAVAENKVRKDDSSDIFNREAWQSSEDSGIWSEKGSANSGEERQEDEHEWIPSFFGEVQSDDQEDDTGNSRFQWRWPFPKREAASAGKEGFWEIWGEKRTYVLLKACLAVLRSASREAKDAAIAILPPSIPSDLISGVVNGTFILIILWLVKCLVQVAHTFGLIALVTFLVVRGTWAVRSVMANRASSWSVMGGGPNHEDDQPREYGPSPLRQKRSASQRYSERNEQERGASQDDSSWLSASQPRTASIRPNSGPIRPRRKDVEPEDCYSSATLWGWPTPT